MARTAHQISLSRLPKTTFAPATRVGKNQNAWTRSSATYKDRVKARSRSFVATSKFREQLAKGKVLRDADGQWHVCHNDGLGFFWSYAKFVSVTIAVEWMACSDMSERKTFWAKHPKSVRKLTGGPFRPIQT